MKIVKGKLLLGLMRLILLPLLFVTFTSVSGQSDSLPEMKRYISYDSLSNTYYRVVLYSDSSKVILNEYSFEQLMYVNDQTITKNQRKTEYYLIVIIGVLTILLIACFYFLVWINKRLNS